MTVGNARSEEQMKKLFRQAAEIAAEVPESMHEAAFHRAFDMLTQESEEVRAPVRQGKRSMQQSVKKLPAQPETESVAEIVISGLDRTKYPEIGRATGVLDRSLHLLRAAKDELDVDGMSPAQIARVLTEKFRVKTSADAVNQALAGADDKVDREKIGRSFTYRIMEKGEAYLDRGAD